MLPLTPWHHINIYGALKAKDAQRARQAVEDHVLDAARKGSEYLGSVPFNRPHPHNSYYYLNMALCFEIKLWVLILRTTFLDMRH